MRLERARQSAPSQTHIVVDGTQATRDQDIRELLRAPQEKARDRGVSLELLGFERDAVEAPRRAVGH